MPGPIEVRDADRAIFASDIHLDDRDRATADSFFEALAREARAASHVFLLGDLFEAWVGDDDPCEVGERMSVAIAALADAGKRVYLMRGNRDFLLDVAMPGGDSSDSGADDHEVSGDPPGRFCAGCGATMLVDPCLVTLFGERALLAHGDALCTDDHAYQAFRATSRSRSWQQAFLAQPLAQRLDEARALRARSESEKAAKADYLMDVNASAVELAMREAGVRLLIHGHTHRPARHRIALGDTIGERWVLPDWDAAQGRGGMLSVTRDGLHAMGDWNPGG